MPAPNRTSISIFRLPIFWLFVGPPIFRFDVHAAGASLEGNLDVWNIFRIAWWLFFGFIIVLELYRNRAQIVPFLRSLKTFPWWVGLWVSTLFISILNSPAPLFTFANATLMLILVLGSFDLSLKIYTGILSIEQALRILFIFTVALLAVFSVTLLFAPELVGRFGQTFGIRARGGFVADNALLSQIAFFIGIYLITISRGFSREAYRLVVTISPAFLLIAQTRAMYASFFVALGLFFLNWLFVEQRHKSVQMLSVLFIVAGSVMGMALYDGLSESSQVLAQVESYLVRGDWDSIQGFNSRDGVAAILIERIIPQPWGLGYSAGPRHVLLNVPYEELLQHGIYEYFAGNAHNMYLEILGGSGILGLASWLMLLLWALYRVWSGRSKCLIPTKVLLIVVLVGGITESYGALPLYQSSSLLWILLAIIASSKVELGTKKTVLV